MTVRSYLVSLPERIIRTVLGFGAGVTHEVGEVALPAAVRRTQLYQNLVETILRYLIEKVGGVEGVYPVDDALSDDFILRRTAGNAVEVLGVVAFRASPVWVLAALADVTGLGRRMIPEIARALEEEGLLEPGREFTTVDQMLEGLERTSGRLASNVNTPPFDVASLRREWSALREEARGMKPARLPSADTIRGMWEQLRAESERQGRTVFETSSLMALAAIRELPAGARWLSASARAGATRTGQIAAVTLLDHYRRTLTEMQGTGYLAFARRQLTPYVRAAAGHFAPGRRTFTERLVDKARSRFSKRNELG